MNFKNNKIKANKLFCLSLLAISINSAIAEELENTKKENNEVEEVKPSESDNSEGQISLEL